MWTDRPVVVTVSATVAVPRRRHGSRTSSMKQLNVVYLLADQLRARSLPAYGERQIETPNIDRLVRAGITFTNAVATCPLCAPYRSMLVTGRQPLETGHVINNVRARHDEISIADAFNHAGYRTGWVGKWHLYSGEQPEIVDFEYIPDGRDRLGFGYFRAYNYHTQYFDGPLCLDGGGHERWRGYETTGLLRYVDEFLEAVTEKREPFCLFRGAAHAAPRRGDPGRQGDPGRLTERPARPRRLPAAGSRAAVAAAERAPGAAGRGHRLLPRLPGHDRRRGRPAGRRPAAAAAGRPARRHDRGVRLRSWFADGRARTAAVAEAHPLGGERGGAAGGTAAARPAWRQCV